MDVAPNVSENKDLLVAPVFGALPMPVKAENYLSSVEATFYAGRSPKGDPLARTHYKTLARSLDHTSPLEPVPVYDFCARFETDVRFAEDTQLFARLDDGATVYVDGKCVFTDNTLHSAQLFAHHPGVIGWQIDNEIFPYSGGLLLRKLHKGVPRLSENKVQNDRRPERSVGNGALVAYIRRL